MMHRPLTLLFTASLFAALLSTPAQADEVCTGYRNIGGNKWRACADAEEAPACPAWSESYSWIGYQKTCYGVPREVPVPVEDLVAPDYPAFCTTPPGRPGGTSYCVDSRAPDGCFVYAVHTQPHGDERTCYVP